MQNRKMSILKVVFLTSFFLLLMGCGASSAKPTPKPIVKTPQWVNSVLPDDNSLYMYGMSIGRNREDAIKAALSDVIARLGTTIESSYESTQKVDGAYSNLKVRSNIKAEVSKIKVNNYKVIKSFKLNYREFAVMVKIDKVKFIDGLKEELRVKQKSIFDKSISIKGSDAISRYNVKKSLVEQANALLPTIYILIELDSLFDKKKNLDFVSKKNKEFLVEARNLKFFISGNKKSKKFIDKIKNYLAQHNFNIVSSKRGAVEIKIVTKDNISRQYIQIAVLNLNISVYDKSKRVGGKSIILKERYNHSIDSVYKNASIHFEQSILKQGINELIGIELYID